MEKEITKKMLNVIRECALKNEVMNSKPQIIDEEHNKEMNFIEEVDYLMSRQEKKKLNESIEDGADDGYVIDKTDKHFGDIRNSQESTLVKTIGENIELGEKALVYYPSKKDLVLSGKISSLNIAFQFRYNDPSGNGIYIWANGMQLTDNNLRVIGKISDGFKNWKQQLLQNADLMEKLHKIATK